MVLVIMLLFQLILVATVSLSVAIFLCGADRRRRDRLSTRKPVEFVDWYNQFYGPGTGLSEREVKSIIEAISNAIKFKRRN